jgi:CheY-like chemotaxis protein
VESRKVLFLTSDKQEVDPLVPLLEEAGYEWQHLKTPDDLVFYLDKFEPNLVVLNALIPRGNAADICRSIRKSGKAKILILSAIASPTMLLQARHRWEMDEIVALPAPAQKLMMLIGYLLGDNPVRPYLRGMSELAPRPDQSPELKAPTNKVSLTGDLHDVPVGRLLAMIVGKRLAGSLVLGDGLRQRRLLVAEGRVLAVKSRYLPRLGLGDILVRWQGFDGAQLRPMLDEATRQSLRLGELLLAQKMIEPAALEQALNRQVVEKLADVFRWDGGHYEFIKNAKEIGKIPEPRNLMLAKVAFQAARAASDPGRFTQLFGIGQFERVAANPAAAIRANMLDLTADEKRFISELRGDKPVSRVVDEGPLSPDAAKSLLMAMLQLRMLGHAS